MAENTVWKLPYTAEQIQAAQENLIPIIGENEHWWRWDIDKMQWADTGKSAAPAIIGEFNSNPNLLDNWYFADPINQRGQTEYNGVGYTIDRWWGNSAKATYSVNEDGIAITAPISEWVFEQRVDVSHIIPGREYTFSILYKAKNTRVRLVVTWAAYQFFYNEGSLATDEYSVATVTGVIPDDGSIDFCYAVIQPLDADGVVDVKAGKLEQGSHQTLAHQDEEGSWVLNDPPPNKELELLKCCMSTADPNDTYANNKVTPAAINAVNKSGDTMTENLNFHRVSLERQNALIPWEDGLHIRDLIDEQNYSDIIVRNESWPVAVRMINGVHYSREIFNEANKPSGSFTGNGSSATRTIETGGIGNAILIWGSPNDRPYCIILTRTGGFGWHNGSYTNQYPDSAKFEDGVLTMSYSGNGFNESGTTYYYQVL